jgi:CRISPR-associated protein Csd1
MQKLCETYDNCSSEIGRVIQNEDGKKGVPLLPVAHTVQSMQIEITIDMEGNFKQAALVPTTDAATIIPCTESSGGRTSGLEAHPLCDGLQYVAADYVTFGGSKKPGFAFYQKRLRDWCESEYAHPKAQAVLKYVSRGHVVKDLIDAHVLMAEDGKLLDKWDKKVYQNAPGIKQDQAFVRFIVWEPGEKQASVWDDKSLHESWIRYYASIKENTALCYITGEEKPVADQHPRFIRTSGDGAKLISANDTYGFTYRGRFSTAIQACTVSYEVSQKAHYALKWLIDRQGQVFYEKSGPGLTIVAWATSGLPVPDPLGDTLDILEFSDLAADTETPVYTAQEFALKLNQKITGYHQSLGSMADIVVMALHSATPGRMSISFYRELKGSDFITRIEKWHNECLWAQRYYDADKKAVKFFVGAPSPRIIAEAVYGSRVDDKLRRYTVERLLPCIIDSHKIPRDLMESAVRRASNRAGAEDERKWETALGVACALYRKHHHDYKGEDIGMVLDDKRTSRDYLYGRLLAIADVLEQRALSKAEMNRPTNAARYMQRFADRPFSTWRWLELALEPYKSRLADKARYYQYQMDEVMSLFEPNEFISDKKLSGEFLLGYHCQRQALKFSSNRQNETNEEDK